MITVEVTPESATRLRIRLDNAQKGVAKGLSAGVNAAAIALASHIKKDLVSGQLVNNRTGNLRRGIFSRMVGDASAVVGVGSEVPYARFVNDGTRPHVITAVNGKALRFVVNGQALFRKSVNHPGIRARQFMQIGLSGFIVDIKRIIQERVNRGLKGGAVE